MATFDALLVEAPILILGLGEKIDNPRTRTGNLPIAYGEFANAPTTSPEVGLISVLSPTSIRVNFVVPAINNAALVNVGNYVITPTLTVYSVTPGGGGNPSYVDLVISEQKTGQSYTLTLQRIVRA